MFLRVINSKPLIGSLKYMTPTRYDSTGVYLAFGLSSTKRVKTRVWPADLLHSQIRVMITLFVVWLLIDYLYVSALCLSLI